MNKIIKISGALKRIFGLLTPIPLFSGLVLWVGATYQRPVIIANPFGLSDLINTPVPLFNDVSVSLGFMGFITLFPWFILQSYWLWQLKRLFELYAKGQIFIAENGTYVRRAAIAFLSITLISMVINSLLSVVLAVNNMVSIRLLFITVGILQICNVLMSIVLVVMAWIMDEARHLKEEIDFTV